MKSTKTKMQEILENSSLILSNTNLDAGQVIAMAESDFNNEYSCDIDYSQETIQAFFGYVAATVKNAKRIAQHEMMLSVGVVK